MEQPSKQEIGENLEINVLSASQPLFKLPNKFTSVFPALSHRNYQYYFLGQSVSLVGFWLQAVGMGWLVFDLTKSPFWVGAVAAASGLPFLILSIFAGVLVDRVNKQKLLVWTQITEAAVATLISLMVFTDTINVGAILALAFVSGIAGSIDLPARLSFVVEMVGKKDLASAISVNIGVFNGARFIGPAIAGGLIAGVGVGWTFLLNALSFIPGILAILAIKSVHHIEPNRNQHPLESLREGLMFVYGDKRILALMLLGGITAFFEWPYQTLMPAIAENVFNAGAGGLGTLLAAAGLGSLAGAAFTSAQTKKENKNSFIYLGIIVASLSLVGFSLNANFLFAHVLLFAAGFGVITKIATINTIIQVSAPDQMRGRVNALYLTFFVGAMPLGNTFAGILAEQTSSLFAIGLGALIVGGVGVYYYLNKLL